MKMKSYVILQKALRNVRAGLSLLIGKKKFPDKEQLTKIRKLGMETSDHLYLLADIPTNK